MKKQACINSWADYQFYTVMSKNFILDFYESLANLIQLHPDHQDDFRET